MVARGTIWYLWVPLTAVWPVVRMRISDSLDDVFESRGHVRVLRALDALPDGLAVSARDIARRAEVAHNRASEILAALTMAGLARVQRAGRADLYQLSHDHVLYAGIHELFREEARVRDELVRFLRRRLTRIRRVREAFVFGSVARGESRASSDIDLALVIPPSGASAAEQAQIDAVAREVRTRFGSELGVHISAQPLESRVKGRTGRALWRRVAEEGIRLIPARADA
jgi:predicted nucleotidyltransferase